tara:strand:- start:30 stop:137 length:108 start_codon:yes stop_codon:yes gene_type:complete
MAKFKINTKQIKITVKDKVVVLKTISKKQINIKNG